MNMFDMSVNNKSITGRWVKYLAEIVHVWNMREMNMDGSFLSSNKQDDTQKCLEHPINQWDKFVSKIISPSIDWDS